MNIIMTVCPSFFNNLETLKLLSVEFSLIKFYHKNIIPNFIGDKRQNLSFATVQRIFTIAKIHIMIFISRFLYCQAKKSTRSATCLHYSIMIRFLLTHEKTFYISQFSEPDMQQGRQNVLTHVYFIKVFNLLQEINES